MIRVWAQLAELGLLSIPFSEAAGGFGGGAVDLMSAMQAVGAALLVEPLLPTWWPVAWWTAPAARRNRPRCWAP